MVGSSIEMSALSRRWARNVVVAFRRKCKQKRGYTTKKWEEKEMLALKQWAGRKSEEDCFLFEWWMVDVIHNTMLFEEINHDGAATKVAQQLAEFYRGKRIPKSSETIQFCRAVNITWGKIRGIPLSHQYSIHIECAIARQAVYDMMMKTLKNLPAVEPKLLREKKGTIDRTFADHVHDALERHQEPEALAPLPQTQDVAPETARPPIQLKFLW